MLAIGNQVKIIGELHRFRNFLKDINTEPLAALFDVTWLLICFISNRVKKQTKKKPGFYTRGKILPFAIKTPTTKQAPLHSSAQFISGLNEDINQN